MSDLLPEKRAWLADDVWLSIPAYLRRSIQKAHLAAVAPQPAAPSDAETMRGACAEACDMLAGRPNDWGGAYYAPAAIAAFRESAATIRALPLPPASDAAEGLAGWQPIETWEGQPTGQAHPVILCVSDGGEHDPAVGEAWFDPETYDGSWWWAGTGVGDYYASPIFEIQHGVPTHWRPVPDAPAEALRRFREGGGV